MSNWWRFAGLFAVLLAARMCHVGILWPEEDLPLAAAAQMSNGRMLYLDAWFDKPPLLAAVHLLWGARDGWPIRLGGAIHAWIACFLGWLLARDWWGEREGWIAAGLLGFFLTFDTPAAVVPMAADLTLLVPHLAAILLARRGQAFWSGVAAGVGFAINTKAVFVAAACALWLPRSLPMLAAGFLAPNVLVSAWLVLGGAWQAYLDQVWRWPRLYAEHTFLDQPLRTGVVRTLNWTGFHAAAVLAALAYWLRSRDPERWRWLAWLAVSAAAVMLGLRFFPRYYFQVLPVIALAAARGFTLMPKRAAIAVALLLLIPAIRFGPRYGLLAADLIAGRQPQWSDIAMDQDSREASRIVRGMAQPGDTLLVWGFRPEMFVYTGLPAGSPYLDSQPLDGVAADRHLFDSTPTMPDWARENRANLRRYHPTFIIDGLGPYNPALGIDRFPDLAGWLKPYREAARTKGSIILRR